MQEMIVDPRLTNAEEHAEGVRQAQVLFKLNHLQAQRAAATSWPCLASTPSSSPAPTCSSTAV